MFLEQDKGARTTVLAFSGLAPKNHVYEWCTAFSSLDANFIGIHDVYNAWYQIDLLNFTSKLFTFLRRKKFDRLVCLGGSAGGFAALIFGHILNAHKTIAFSPQSACGEKKRLLGDDRWAKFCLQTPSVDLKRFEFKADVYFSLGDELDTLHAKRLSGKINLFGLKYEEHNIALVLKEKKQLEKILSEAI